MARGITQEDVWKACDALLLEGARPTIERVRLKLGRGSPNTVSPMLDTWFKRLGGRITDPGAFAAPPELPDPVQQAAQYFWEAAQAEARRDLDARLKEGMADAIANVQAEKERAAIADAAAFSATAKASRLQTEMEELRSAFDAERLQHAATAAQLEEVQRQLASTKLDALAAQRQVDAERARADQLIAAADARAAGAERRANLEIEQERLLRAKAEKTSESLSQRLEATHKERSILAEQLSQAQERLTQEAARASQLEAARAAAMANLEARAQAAEADLREAKLALSGAEAQGALVAQLVAKLEPMVERQNERRVESQPAQEPTLSRATARKKKTAA